MTTTAQRPQSGALGLMMTKRQKTSLAVMCMTTLLISIDQSALNVAIPTLVRSLRPSSSGLQWIADSYILTNAVMLLLCSALGDRYGRRLIFLLGSAIFGGGSLLCALSTSTVPLVAGRVVTGFAAAMLTPTTLAIIAASFAGPLRTKAIAIWAGSSGVGIAAGPLVSGWLLEHYWWGSVFLVNVPLSVIAVLGALAIDESRAEDPAPLDPVGVALSAAGLAALTYALIVAPTKHWGSPEVLGALVVSVVTLAAFVRWDRSREQPLFDLDLFKNPVFSAGLLSVTALFFALFGVGFLLSQYMQFVQGADPLGVGLRFLPMAALTIIGSNVAPRLEAWWGTRAVVAIGMTLILIALLSFLTISPSSGYLAVAGAFSFQGAGMGLAVATASTAVFSTLPTEKIGRGSGVRSTVQLLAGSFGIAVVGTVATTRYRGHVTTAYSGPLSGVPQSVRPSITDQLGRAVVVAHKLPGGLALQVRSVTDAAFLSGLRLGIIIELPIVVVAIVVAAVYLPSRRDTAAISEEEASLSAAAAASA